MPPAKIVFAEPPAEVVDDAVAAHRVEVDQTRFGVSQDDVAVGKSPSGLRTSRKFTPKGRLSMATKKKAKRKTTAKKTTAKRKKSTVRKAAAPKRKFRAKLRLKRRFLPSICPFLLDFRAYSLPHS